MAGLFSPIKRNYTVFNPPSPVPSSQPLKFGILGAARIAPPALIIPAKSHPEVVVYAVAAGDLGRAQTFARKHGIRKVYGGGNAYQELLDDPEVDAVYNPLPNGLHYEWTIKALHAGKHVLLEKPSSNSAEETRKMFELAEEKGLVLLEAFHYRFHPAVQRFKDIIDSGELGAIRSIEAKMHVPRGIISKGDIRFDFNLGGGALMDCGCYTMNYIRYLAGANPTEVLTADPTVQPANPEIDVGLSTTLGFSSTSISTSDSATDPRASAGNITATLSCHLSAPSKFGFMPRLTDVYTRVICEGGEAMLFNFPLPTLYHYIEVIKTDGSPKGNSKKRVEKVYSFRDFPKGDERRVEGKGEEWWLTYRYQLGAFVDQVKGRKPHTWVSAQDSVDNMKAIEMVYEKAGLKARPLSMYVDPQAVEV